jgi:hypothetical protein
LTTEIANWYLGTNAQDRGGNFHDAASSGAHRELKAVHQAIARLQQATGAASLTILKLMTDPNVPAAVKLRAAESVIDHAIKAVELEDIETRLAALEEAAQKPNR